MIGWNQILKHVYIVSIHLNPQNLLRYNLRLRKVSSSTCIDINSSTAWFNEDIINTLVNGIGIKWYQIQNMTNFIIDSVNNTNSSVGWNWNHVSDPNG